MLLLPRLVAGAIGVLWVASAAQAGWFTLRNDTHETIVVQETITVNGQVKRGKPTSLLPGEKLREFLPGPTVKNIEVFPPDKPNQPTWTGSLDCKDERQTFSITGCSGHVKVEPVSCPK